MSKYSFTEDIEKRISKCYHNKLNWDYQIEKVEIYLRNISNHTGQLKKVYFAILYKDEGDNFIFENYADVEIEKTGVGFFLSDIVNILNSGGLDAERRERLLSFTIKHYKRVDGFINDITNFAKYSKNTKFVKMFLAIIIKLKGEHPDFMPFKSNVYYTTFVEMIHLAHSTGVPLDKNPLLPFLSNVKN
jgi:hypothetical protein